MEQQVCYQTFTLFTNIDAKNNFFRPFKHQINLFPSKVGFLSQQITEDFQVFSVFLSETQVEVTISTIKILLSNVILLQIYIINLNFYIQGVQLPTFSIIFVFLFFWTQKIKSLVRYLLPKIHNILLKCLNRLTVFFIRKIIIIFKKY